MSKISKALERAKMEREVSMGGSAQGDTPPAARSGFELDACKMGDEPCVPGEVPDYDVMTPSLYTTGNSSILPPPFGRIISDGREAYGVFSPQTARDLERRKELLEENRVMTFLPERRYIDHYNYLRTQILQRTRDDGLNTLMVTSVNRGEGKTLTAINLALSLSREARQTALIVDANLRYPAVAKTLGLAENALGLSDYLFNDLDVRDLIINPRLGNMIRVMLSGKPLIESSDILSLPKVADLVKELKSRYSDRYVIFDCPHLKHMPDALLFSSYVDGIILVVEAGRTTREELQETLKHLRRSNIVGLVLNKFRE